MGELIHPLLVYGLCLIGGVGLYAALPKGGRTPQVFGALVAAAVVGVALLVMGVKASDHLPSVYFYIFALIGTGAALRVITHPRPVYAALYFILTVISTGGLFVLLSAEFMAFALIIVYAGAILITYLFVIMLATQAPQENETEALASYDTQAREPLAATVVGFVLLAVLTTLMFRGVSTLPRPRPAEAGALAADMPRKLERALEQANLLHEGEVVATVEGRAVIDAANNTVRVMDASGGRRDIGVDPSVLEVSNVEALGFNLLRDHPGAIEIAGVILLMAMLGAVVLSRKQVELDDEAKRAQAGRLGGGADGAMGGGA